METNKKPIEIDTQLQWRNDDFDNDDDNDNKKNILMDKYITYKMLNSINWIDIILDTNTKFLISNIISHFDKDVTNLDRNQFFYLNIKPLIIERLIYFQKKYSDDVFGNVKYLVFKYYNNSICIYQSENYNHFDDVVQINLLESEEENN
jgi:hypothetical protein